MFDMAPLDAPPVRKPAAASSQNGPGLDAETAGLFARRLSLAFRGHPHLSNVLTHVAAGRWDHLEAALIVLLAAPSDIVPLSPLERNLLDLLWIEGGITGRIMKPLFFEICRAALPPEAAERCIVGIRALSSRVSASAFE